MLADVLNYNRSAKEWQVATGEKTVAFPAGQVGKMQAFRLAIFVENPAVYQLASQMAKENPALELRAWRAAELVINGNVNLNVPGVLAQVQGSEIAPYNITAADGQIACDCPDWQEALAPYMENSQRVCKHILAYFFSGQDESPEPEAAVARYADGSLVEDDLLSNWRAYSELNNRPPENRERLISWIYR